MKLRISPILKRISNIYQDKVPKTVREATKRRINNDTLKLITNISEDMRSHIGELLRDGEDQGRSVAATASRLLTTGLDKGVFRSARRRAYLIARTELHRARQRAAVDLYKAADIKLVTWVGIADDKICNICEAKNGVTYHLEDMEESLPPVHPRCRCRLLPSNYDIKILPKQKGVTRMKITHQPDDYKYVIKVKNLGKSIKNFELEKSKEKYSSVLAELPPFMSEKVIELAGRVDPMDLHEKNADIDEPHITVRYGLHTEVPDEAKRALWGAALPLKAAIVGVDVFEPDERDYDVLVLLANSPILEELNDRLGYYLESTSDFKFYQPHVTIAYLKRGVGDKYRQMVTGLEGQMIEMTEFNFSDKDHHKVQLDIEKGKRIFVPAGVGHKAYTRFDPRIKELEHYIGKDPKVGTFARNWNEEAFLLSPIEPGTFFYPPIHETGYEKSYNIDDPEHPRMLKTVFSIAKDKQFGRYLLMAKHVDEQEKTVIDWGAVGEYDGENIGILAAYRGKGAGTAFVKELMKMGKLRPSIGYSPEGLETVKRAHRELTVKQEPVLYHGTYSPKMYESREEVPEEYLDPGQASSLGIYLTDNPKMAETFGENVHVTKQPEKILDLTKPKTFDDFVDAIGIDKEKNKWALNRVKEDSAFYDNPIEDVYRLLEILNSKFEIVNLVKQKGYDSLKFKEEHMGAKGNTTVVFPGKKVEWIKANLEDELQKSEVEVKQYQRRTKRGISTVKRHRRGYNEVKWKKLKDWNEIYYESDNGQVQIWFRFVGDWKGYFGKNKEMAWSISKKNPKTGKFEGEPGGYRTFKAAKEFVESRIRTYGDYGYSQGTAAKAVEDSLEANKNSPEVKLALSVAESIQKIGGRALFVGGYVRDAILGKKAKDIDVEVYNVNKYDLEAILNKLGSVDAVGRSFGVFKLSNPDVAGMDVSIPRRESKSGAGHKGFMVESDPTMTVKEAAHRRDLTINSLAYDPVKRELIDEFGGLADLKEHKLRATSKERFPDDSLRVLRVMRFAAQLEMQPDDELVEICKKIDLSDLPKERIMGELSGLLLKSQKPSIGLRLIPKLGIDKIMPELTDLQGILQEPEWHPEGDAWEHTLQVMDAAASMRDRLPDPKDQLAFMLACLFHDIGKPQTTVMRNGVLTTWNHDEAGADMIEKVLGRFTDETDILEKVEALVRHHMKPTFFHHGKINNPGIRRLSLKVNIPMVIMVSMADKMGRGERVPDLTAEKWLLDKYSELGLANPRALDAIVMGRHLIQLGIQPGKPMGEILKKIYEAQLDGKFKTVEEGLAYAHEQGWVGRENIVEKSFNSLKKTNANLVLDRTKALQLINRLRKSKVKTIPYRDNGEVVWAKRTPDAYILTNASFQKGDAVLLKSGATARVTAVGKDGLTARDGEGNRFKVWYNDAKKVVTRK